MDSTREDIDVLNSKYKTEFSTTFESAFKLVAKTEQPKKEPNQGINRTESFQLKRQRKTLKISGQKQLF